MPRSSNFKPFLPYYGPEHMAALRPSKTSIELFYDLDTDIREVRLYKNGLVTKPCIVLWDRNDDFNITPDETDVFEEGCRKADGWFKSKSKNI